MIVGVHILLYKYYCISNLNVFPDDVTVMERAAHLHKVNKKIDGHIEELSCVDYISLVQSPFLCFV